MREVDDAHHREHEGQAAGDQRVVAAEQHALDELVDHGRAPPRSVACAGRNRLAVTSSRETSPGRRSSAMRALQHADHAVGHRHGARSRSCSTRTIVVPSRSAPAARRRRGRRPAATGRARPRRAAAGRGWSSAPGRSPSPAARRRTDCRPWHGGAASRFGNISSTRVDASSRPARPAVLPSSRFSSTVICANSRRPSGTRAMPMPTRRCDGTRVMSAPSNSDAPAGRRMRAGDRAQQRGLAGAVGADQRQRLAALDARS